jgi:hypothetical protein
LGYAGHRPKGVVRPHGWSSDWIAQYCCYEPAFFKTQFNLINLCNAVDLHANGLDGAQATHQSSLARGRAPHDEELSWWRAFFGVVMERRGAFLPRLQSLRLVKLQSLALASLASLVIYNVATVIIKHQCLDMLESRCYCITIYLFTLLKWFAPPFTPSY